MAVLNTNSGGARLDGASPFGITNYPFTFACWVRRTADNESRILIGIGNTTSLNNRHQIQINESATINRPMLRSSVGGTVASTTAASATVTPLDTWQPIIGVWASASDRRLYQGSNSVLSSTTDLVSFSSGAGGIGDSNGVFVLGRGTQFTNLFQGMIAHAAVWDKALTESERNAFLANGNPLAIANTSGNQHLLAYWAEDFFQIGGTGAWYYEDKSGNNNHLTLEANAVRDTNTDGPEVDDPPSTGLAFTVAPTVTSRTTDSYTIGGTLSESGDVFAVAILPEATDPTTPAQIIAGTDGGDVAARGTGQQLGVTSFSFNVTGGSLSANPTHDIFVVGRKQT
jgi:hypothetical protein